MRETSSRREEIIRAAFALTEEFSSWTLAEVAARVGVSKPALYRHFRNKEEIEAVMDGTFKEKLLEVIENSDGTQTGFRTTFRDFFRANQGFLDYFVSRVFAPGAYEEELYRYVLSESKRVAEFHLMVERAEDERRQRIVADIMKSIVSIILASVHEPGIETLQDELLDILEEGLPKLTMPGDERLAALEREAVLAPEEFAKDNRLFSAIAASVRDYGFAGTTTERIAEKMGITKSSLYFYYPTKEAMFEELMRTEHEMIIALCASRIRAGQNLAEQLYSLMMVQANYLLMRPDVLPVFNWIRFETLREKRRKGPPDHDQPDPRVLGFRAEEFFGEDSGKNQERLVSLVKWMTILAISAVLQGDRKMEAPEEIRKNVRLVYRSVLLGDRAIQG